MKQQRQKQSEIYLNLFKSFLIFGKKSLKKIFVPQVIFLKMGK